METLPSDFNLYSLHIRDQSKKEKTRIKNHYLNIWKIIPRASNLGLDMYVCLKYFSLTDLYLYNVHYNPVVLNRNITYKKNNVEHHWTKLYILDIDDADYAWVWDRHLNDEEMEKIMRDVRIEKVLSKKKLDVICQQFGGKDQ